jgi:hypothetical protein
LAEGTTQKTKRITRNTLRRSGQLGQVKGKAAFRGGERGDWLAIKEDWVGPQGRFKETLIFEFQKDLDFDKTERNCIRRFRRDLDMGIFPKFF